MAEATALPEPAPICLITAQQLSETGEDPPQRYIWTNITEIDAPLATDIPVIEFSLLVSSTDAELKALHSALTKWGCFQIVNHGIESASLDEVRRLAKEFFHLPMLEKQRYTRQGNNIEGYSSCPSVASIQQVEWSDRLHLQVTPEHRRKLKFWPQNPEHFRKVLEDYSAKIRQVEEQILRSIAKTLSLTDEDYFLRKIATMSAQFNYYPPCSKSDRVIGLRPHTDGSGVTLLLQDRQVRGLQLLHDNQWLSVPIMPEALLVLVGDQLEIMSNGIFKSPMHRVVINSEAERNSVAMFCLPDVAEEIEPLDQLVDEDRPKMYKKVTNYVGSLYNYYHQGKRAIDAVRI
ncbi:protein SRG1-like [Salvia hispanica]|uniref:protein SRG1-like n=1 Tax=Salvia hispanica TaxID=49212 RepID=UPI002009657F|nr:protein SRG1-like [Salvia hispanica]